MEKNGPLFQYDGYLYKRGNLDTETCIHVNEKAEIKPGDTKDGQKTTRSQESGMEQILTQPSEETIPVNILILDLQPPGL